MANENFKTMVDKAMQGRDLSQMRPVVEKELLHYDILFALEQENLLKNIVFQGGTALRLCYGGQRLSEDLDFVGGNHFQTSQLHEMKQCLEHYIGERYGLEVTVKEPNEIHDDGMQRGVTVDKWQIRIVTAPDRPDIPKQMIKIEVASVPAYTAQPKALQYNYDFLPDGYSDTLVMVETLDEIMADKLVSFPSCHRYIRYRDIWDLQWLKKQGAKFSIDLVNKKVNDYQVKDYKADVNSMITRLPEIIHGKDFRAQMSRFIPLSIQERTLKKDIFYNFLEEELREIFGVLN